VTEAPGTVIGPYKLLEQIGEGGFGVVFLAEQQAPVRRKVALKVLKRGMDTRQVVARFEAERQALAIMDHPNIAKVHDGGQTASGRPYFVMELVKGMPITEFCDQAQLMPRQRLELFGSVCQAVQHAHQKGIIHRDLKPSNVLVSRHDTTPIVKVIDFGVAKALGQELTDKTLFTGIAQMIGTPLYMSPEQAGMSDLDIDTRSDIYSLGVLLYELLTGTTPFDQERLRTMGYDEIRRIIREEEPPKPSTRISTLGQAATTVSTQRKSDPKHLSRLFRGELDWIVMKGLEKDRNRRYETANGLAQDIQRYLADEPVQACPPSAVYRFRKFVRRNKVPVLTVAIVLGVLVGGIVGTAWGLVQARRSAAAEKAANELTKKRLAQIVKGNQIISGIFTELDIEEVKTGTQPLEAVLAEHLVKAAEQLEGESVGDPLMVAALQEQLGKSLIRLGFADRAIPILKKSRQTRQEALGPDHADTLSSMSGLALAYEEAGKLDLSLPLKEETFELAKARFGSDHPDTLDSMNSLAEGYRIAGKVDLAMPLYKEYLKLTRTKFGPDDVRTLVAMNNLAGGYLEAGKLDLALPLAEETYQLMKTKLPLDHPYTLSSTQTLAWAYRDVGKLDLALPLFEKTLSLRKTKLGPNHPHTLLTMNALAHGYRDAGKLDLALPLFEEQLRLTKAKHGPDHPRTLDSMNDLAACYWSLCQLDKSIPLFKDVLKAREAKLGRQNPLTLLVVANLGVNYRDIGRLDQALPLLEEAYGGTKKYPGLPWIGGDLLDAYTQANKRTDSLVLFKELLADARSTQRPDSTQLAGRLARLGLSLLTIKDFAEAEPILREALSIRQKIEPDLWTTFSTQSQLGGAILGHHKYADAEPLLIAGFAGMKKRENAIPPRGKVRLAEAADRLVELYAQTNKPDELKKWQRERTKYPPTKSSAPLKNK
jgi:tetratricopeptide (TPR) repeat protein